jgi:hypothetical protein
VKSCQAKGFKGGGGGEKNAKYGTFGGFLTNFRNRAKIA